MLAAFAMSDRADDAWISVGKRMSEVLSDMKALLKAFCEHCLRLMIMCYRRCVLCYEQYLCHTSVSPAAGSPELAEHLRDRMTTSAESATIERDEVRV